MGGTLEKPLAGCRVLDFSQAEAGPIATELLADFGARVIKVERPPGGDLLRQGYGHVFHGISLPFASLNRGKESIAIDLKQARGMQIVHRLIESSDVLTHNFRAGVMERMGLGYGDLEQRYPRLVYGEVTGYGSVGPLAGQGGQDVLAQALSGLMQQNAAEDGTPRLVGYPVADFATGMSLVTGILMALLGRERHGSGCKVSTSLLEGALFSALQEVTEAQMGQRLTQGEDPLCGVFQTSDGAIVVMPIWRSDAALRLFRAMECAHLADEPRMAHVGARQAHFDWVKETLAAQFRTRPSAYWLSRLEREDVLGAEVTSFSDVDKHPQVAAIDPWAVFETPDGASGRTVAAPFRLAGARPNFGHVPAVGQSTVPILWELGYGAPEIEQLLAEGVVATSEQDLDLKA